jgi:hypothetical protein
MKNSDSISKAMKNTVAHTISSLWVSQAWPDHGRRLRLLHLSDAARIDVLIALRRPLLARCRHVAGQRTDQRTEGAEDQARRLPHRQRIVAGHQGTLLQLAYDHRGHRKDEGERTNRREREAGNRQIGNVALMVLVGEGFPDEAHARAASMPASICASVT